MIEEGENQALLPAGLHDLLPPDAAHEVALTNALVATFGGHGYERVSPPLIEFESSLIGAGGPGMGAHVFRVLDPAGGRMMAVRADMTPQVARIAATRLARSPRPLRLSYGGQVLIVKGSQMRPERQIAQAGAELIGVDSVEADVEILVLAVDALARIGIETPTIDLNSPALVGSILEALEADNGRVADLRAALDRKDSAAVADLAGNTADILLKLI
ncbi:MAG: ATP phosphoribosyltransferase regulatory subunit, partial [Alphaproteobacteria bacterium]|nr:ATP phosphoribosyltransferase regulatory subunit [Alphaproteobacteria bacterium]